MFKPKPKPVKILDFVEIIFKPEPIKRYEECIIQEYGEKRPRKLIFDKFCFLFYFNELKIVINNNPCLIFEVIFVFSIIFIFCPLLFIYFISILIF